MKAGLLRKSKILKVLILSMLFTLMFGTISAYAAVEGNNADIKSYISGGNVSSSVSSYFSKSNGVDTSKDTSYVYYVSSDGSTYYYIKLSDEANAIAAIKSQANKDNLGNDVGSMFGTDSGQLDIRADTTSAATSLKGFTPIVNYILGAMVILISIGMTIFSAFDICFIAFPTFRNKCEESKQSGGVMASNKKSSSGDTKLRFVSDDAQYAVIAADTVQSGKNPFTIYFKKRLVSYIALAVLLFILFTGRVTIFTSLALKLVDGILDLLQGL